MKREFRSGSMVMSSGVVKDVLLQEAEIRSPWKQIGYGRTKRIIESNLSPQTRAKQLAVDL